MLHAVLDLVFIPFELARVGVFWPELHYDITFASGFDAQRLWYNSKEVWPMRHF